MGMIRKLTSMSSAGLVSYHSPREQVAIASKKSARADMKMAKAQAKLAKAQRQALKAKDWTTSGLPRATLRTVSTWLPAALSLIGALTGVYTAVGLPHPSAA